MIVISILAKVTLVLGAGAAMQIALARRVSAATRHLIWMLAIAGVLLLPALAISLPDWAPVEYTEPAGFVPILGAGTPEPPVLEALTGAIPRRQNSIQWPVVLTMVYLTGLVLLLMRVVLQHVWTHRLVRAATPTTEAPWLQLLAECRARIGVRRAVRLLRTAGDTMPLAAGIRQAFIVLPEVADTWPEDRRRAVLLHELAHVERHDCLTQTLAALACAVYWVHPGVWWIATRLRAERELACDDRVLSAGENAREYAGHLLELAYTLDHSAAPGVAVTMARPRAGRPHARRARCGTQSGDPRTAKPARRCSGPRRVDGAGRGGDDHAPVPRTRRRGDPPRHARTIRAERGARRSAARVRRGIDQAH
jgi:bla regulator protein BlaR1